MRALIFANRKSDPLCWQRELCVIFDSQSNPLGGQPDHARHVPLLDRRQVLFLGLSTNKFLHWTLECVHTTTSRSCIGLYLGAGLLFLSARFRTNKRLSIGTDQGSTRHAECFPIAHAQPANPIREKHTIICLQFGFQADCPSSSSQSKPSFRLLAASLTSFWSPRGT